MARSLRVGGCTFAETPRRPAPAARLLWSATFDPSVLLARPARSRVSAAEAPSLATFLSVTDDERLHAVIGSVHHGVRIDVAGCLQTLPLGRLTFPFTISVAPRQIAEFRRLVAFARGRPFAERARTRRLDRIVLALRVIDALGEGASLRTIGEAFVRAGDWPGRGESTKSAARRLRTAALAIWNAGPRTIFS